MDLPWLLIILDPKVPFLGTDDFTVQCAHKEKTGNCLISQCFIAVTISHTHTQITASNQGLLPSRRRREGWSCCSTAADAQATVALSQGHLVFGSYGSKSQLCNCLLNVGKSPLALAMAAITPTYLVQSISQCTRMSPPVTFHCSTA